MRYLAPTNIRIDPSKWIEAWLFAHHTVCDWNGLHQIKTGNLICGFPKMGDSNMWISRGIATPLRWEWWDLGFPTNNGSLHFSCGLPMVFRCFFPHISPGISRDLLVPHLVLRCLTKGHQLATGDQEARHDDQHATWKGCRRKFRSQTGQMKSRAGHRQREEKD